MICFFISKKFFSFLATISEKPEAIMLLFLAVTRNSILPDL